MDKAAIYRKTTQFGIQLNLRNEFRKSEEVLKLAIHLIPNGVYAYVALGALYGKYQHLEKAVDCFKNAIQFGRHDGRIFYELAHLYFLLFDFHNARKALEKVPNDFLKHEKQSPKKLSLQVQLEVIKRLEEMGLDLSLPFKTISLNKPDCNLPCYPFAKTLSKLSVSAYRQGDILSAEQLALASIRFLPLLDTYNLLTLIKAFQKRYSEGERYLKKAFELSQDASIYRTAAHHFLKLGAIQKGWECYAIGKKAQDDEAFKKHLGPLKKLTNQKLANKALVVVQEQGFGDCIQYARFFLLPQKHRLKSLTFACRKELYDLMQFNFPKLHIITLEEIPKNIESFDGYMMQGDYARLYRWEQATIPFRDKYLSAPLQNAHKFKKLISKTGKPKIGICWEVNDIEPSSHYLKHLPLDQINRIIDCSYIDFYSLQYGTAERQLKKSPHKKNVQFLGRHLENFSDTAAAIEQMDLVITPDTAVHHLAGSMGKNNYLLLPYQRCWRWFDATSTNPWYTSSTIFSQDIHGSWDSVFLKLSKHIRNIYFTYKN